MKPLQNSIHKTTFNFEYGSKISASKGNHVLESIFDTHILPEIEKAVTKKVPKEALLKLQKLEIDIGAINEKDITTNLASSIRMALEKALHAELTKQNKRTYQDPLHQEITFDKYLLEPIKTFLSKGYLPFWVDTTVTIDDLVSKAIQQSTGEYIKILNTYQKNDHVVKRVAYGLDTKVFDKTIVALAPDHSAWIIELRKILLHIKKERNLQWSTNEFMHAINYYTLDYLLNNRNTLFNRSNFSMYVIKKVSGAFHLDAPQLSHSIKTYTGNISIKKEIQEAIKKLQSPGEIIFTEDINTGLEVPELLKLLNSDNVDLKTLDRDVLSYEIAMILRHKKKRHLLLEKLNENGASLVLELCYPNQVTVFIHLIKAFVKMSDDLKKEGILTKNKISIKKCILITIQYLSKDAIRVFNNEEYILFLLSSAGFPMYATTNTEAFKNLIRSNKYINVKKTALLIEEEIQYQEISSLQTLLSQSKDRQQFSEKKTKKSAADITAYFSIYRKKIIEYYLTSGQLPIAFYDLSWKDFQKLFNDLVKEKDDFLIRLFRKNKNPEVLIDRVYHIIADEPAKQIEKYINFFLEEEYELLSEIFRQHSDETLSKTVLAKQNLSTLIKKLNKLGAEKLKTLFALILSDHVLFDKFVALLKDGQILAEVLFRNDNIQKYIQPLILFSPGLLSTSVHKEFWKSVVVRFFVLTYLKGIKITVSLLTTSFMEYLLQRLKAIGQEYQFNTILDTLKASDSKELKIAIASWFTLHKSVQDQEEKTVHKQSLAYIQPEIFITQLASFSIGTLSDQIDTTFWRSVVLDFNTKHIEKGTEISLVAFTTSFMRYLLERLEAVGETHQFDAIVDTLKASSSKELKIAIASWYTLNKSIQDQEEKIVYKQSLAYIQPEIFITQLASFSIGTLSDQIDTTFWRSVVLDFNTKHIEKGTEITLVAFTKSFMRYLLERLEAVGETHQFDPIIDTLKTSDSAALNALARSWFDSHNTNADKKESNLQKAIREIRENILTLQLYADKGSLPQWSTASSFSEIIDRLHTQTTKYPETFEKQFLQLEKTTPIFVQLISKLSQAEIKRLSQLFYEYPKLKTLWETALRKIDAIEGLKTEDQEEKIVYKPSLGYIQPEIFIKQLVSFSIGTLSDQIDTRFWRSVVLDFNTKHIEKGTEITLISFTKSFMRYLLERLEAVGETHQFDPIVDTLKTSDSAALNALVRSWFDSYNTNADKNESRLQKANREIRENILILQFYAHKGSLPQWSTASSFVGIIDRLHTQTTKYPETFEKQFLLLEKTTPIFVQLISQLSPAEIKRFSQLFYEYPKLKTLWETALSKIDTIEGLKTENQEEKLDPKPSLAYIQSEIFIKPLASFSIGTLSDQIDTRFWRSVVLDFNTKHLEKGIEITLVSFTKSFMRYLLERLEAIGETHQFDTIIDTLKTSDSKALNALVHSWFDGSKKPFDAYNTSTNKNNIKPFDKNESKPQNAIKEIQENIVVLQFYTDKGFLPWWSNKLSFSEIVDGLYRSMVKYPETFEKQFLLLEKTTPIFVQLIPKLSQATIKRLSQLFYEYPALKTLWETALRKVETTEGLKTGNQEWKYPKDSTINVVLQKFIKQRHIDKDALYKILYFLSDEDILKQWNPINPEISNQIKTYTSLSSHFYFRNMNPIRWRQTVYEFVFDHYGKNKYTSNQFTTNFLKYVKKNYSHMNWNDIFISIHQTIQSSIIKSDITFPKELIQLITSEKEESQERNKTNPQEKNILEEDTGIEVKVNNAGIILFWPFLRRFFEHLSLVKNGVFINQEAVSKAIYLLQYLVFNEVNFPEYQMVLNKVIVGMPSQEHLPPSIELSQNEKDFTHSLLNGLINNWEKVKNSTPEGIQETFLQREGILNFKKESLELRVEKKGVDVLLEGISWNISMIKLPWMEKPMHVKWI